VDWSQVSATCLRAILIVLTLQPVPGAWNLSFRFFCSLYYTNKVFCDILRPDEPQSILYPCSLSPPYLYPSFSSCFLCFPIIMYHYTLIIFLSDPSKIWNILSPLIPPTTFFFLSPLFMLWFLPWSLFPIKTHGLTLSYKIPHHPTHSNPLPACPPPPFYYLLPIFLHAFESIICICRYIIYSIE